MMTTAETPARATTTARTGHDDDFVAEDCGVVGLVEEVDDGAKNALEAILCPEDLL